jgi:hypothetical protein
MPTKTISLLYTTARPHLIPEVIGRWFAREPNEIEMIVVTDDAYPATVFRNHPVATALRFVAAGI